MDWCISWRQATQLWCTVRTTHWSQADSKRLNDCSLKPVWLMIRRISRSPTSFLRYFWFSLQLTLAPGRKNCGTPSIMVSSPSLVPKKLHSCPWRMNSAAKLLDTRPTPPPSRKENPPIKRKFKILVSLKAVWFPVRAGQGYRTALLYGPGFFPEKPCYGKKQGIFPARFYLLFMSRTRDPFKHTYTGRIHADQGPEHKLQGF